MDFAVRVFNSTFFSSPSTVDTVICGPFAVIFITCKTILCVIFLCRSRSRRYVAAAEITGCTFESKRCDATFYLLTYAFPITSTIDHFVFGSSASGNLPLDRECADICICYMCNVHSKDTKKILQQMLVNDDRSMAGWVFAWECVGFAYCKVKILICIASSQRETIIKCLNMNNNWFMDFITWSPPTKSIN